MFVILIIISTVAVTSALMPAGEVKLADEKARNVISKYISKIPDIKEQYIVDERLSKAISHYFSGKISSFPLYKISLTIDRNPIKMPWTFDAPKLEKGKEHRIQKQENKRVQKRYKHLRSIVTKDTTTTTVSTMLTKKPVEDKGMRTSLTDTSSNPRSSSSTSHSGSSSTLKPLDTSTINTT